MRTHRITMVRKYLNISLELCNHDAVPIVWKLVRITCTAPADLTHRVVDGKYVCICPRVRLE